MNSIRNNFVFVPTQVGERLIGCFIAFLMVLAMRVDAQQKPAVLELGQLVAQPMLGGETHAYQITLTTDQFLRVVADQHGIDVSLRIFSPVGQKLIEMDSLNSTQGFELATVIAEQAGAYRLEIVSSNRTVPPGRYEVKIETLRLATEQDRQWLIAQQSYAEGWQLYLQATAESLPKAVQKFSDALRAWQVMEDALMVNHTLYYLAASYRRLGQTQQALFHFSNALQLVRATPERREEAAVLYNLANVLYELGELRKALDYHEQALALWQSLKDSYGEARTLNNLGLVNSQLGAPQQAFERYSQSLAVWQRLGNRPQMAITLRNLGAAYDVLGEGQKALDLFSQSRAIHLETADQRGEAISLHHLGQLYRKQGDIRLALEHLQKALALWRGLGNRAEEAATLSQIGLAQVQQGQIAEALEHYQQALKLWREAGDRQGEAQILQRIGELQAANEPAKALESYERAQSLLRNVGDIGLQASVHTSIANLHLAQGATQKAVILAQQALTLLSKTTSPAYEAQAFYTLARAERALGNFAVARQHSEAALGKIEALRAAGNQQMRASYLATKQNFYELHIDLLMQAHRAQPSGGFIAEALQTSERARARSLLEELAEARADIRQGADVALLARERELQQTLNAKAQLQLTASGARAQELQQELSTLETEYRQLQVQIRQSSPHYAALTQPQPLKLAELQNQLDADTLLLEYALGAERSYVWAVTKTELTSYELPPQAQITSVAQTVSRLLAVRGVSVKGETPAQQRTRLAQAETQLDEAARKLSDMILAPLAAQLKQRPLLIVADGALQYVPFAMLPEPLRDGKTERRKDGEKADSALRTPIRSIAPTALRTPLIVNHEVVTLPSVSALAELRKEITGRAPAPKLLAVLADPVFTRTDALSRMASLNSPVNAGVAARSLEHEEEQPTIALGRLRVTRLPFTRQEADRIYALAPGVDKLKLLDFQASRAAVTGAALGQYRYLHFATHGLLDSEQPRLSALVLSLVDEKGQAQDGFLRAHEIYNLKLPADLVVLSACQTGLGKEVKGEGLIGLTRGFMYAGAARVIVSLWNVNDRATAELMVKFYERLLKDGQRPAAALRAAQVEMWRQKQWQSPYYWAGFVLQGEWK